MNDELRELFVQYGYPRITQAELKLIPAILQWHDKAVKEARIEELSHVWYDEKEGLIFYSRSGSVTTLTDRIAELQEGKE